MVVRMRMPAVVKAIRTAGSRTSGEYLVCRFMTPSSHRMESPVIPERFNICIGGQLRILEGPVEIGGLVHLVSGSV